MHRKSLRPAVVTALAMLVFSVFFVAGSAASGFHGIAFTKGCNGSTPVGQPYSCGYQILNVADTSGDTLQVTAVNDTVFASGGAVPSGNILHDGQLVFGGTGTVTCTGGSGAGTNASPYVGATSCNLAAGGTIQVLPFSYYTVQPADYTLPNHVLADQAVLHWNDLCDHDLAPKNCPVGDQQASSGSQTTVTQLQSSTATQIHNASHNVVTAVAAGSTVHDFVTVTGQPGSPIPSGNVTLQWFTNGTCTTPAADSALVALDATGHADATSFAKTPAAAGGFAFQATYAGNGTYAGSVGACEPLQVVDANIQITPPTAINPVGTNHTFTAHVNVNAGDGSGFVNAPNGTVITFTIDSGPGTPNPPTSCTTAGGTGSCTTTITSSTPGTTVVSAHVTLSVGGVSLTRNTDATGQNSSPATKLWADDAVSTTVRDGTNADVTNTTLSPGAVVHDTATVAKAAGTPAGVPDPTGTVSFTLYDNGTCNGNVVAVASQSGVQVVNGVATETTTFTVPSVNGSFSYLAHYSGDVNYPAHDGPCEPFSVQGQKFGPALTPGFWKNHEAATTALLPITLGNYNVNTFAKARAVFDAMKCSSPIDCLAGHLLAAKLDLAGGSDPSIQPVINQADALLAAVNYNGPGQFTTPTAAQKALALQLEVLIDNYTNQ